MAGKEALAADESYADQMQEELSKYLVHCKDLPLTENQSNNISQMLRIVDELESMTDDCYSVGLLLNRSVEKKMSFAPEDLERLDPYIDLVNRFLEFIRSNINRHLSTEQLEEARMLEDQID